MGYHTNKWYMHNPASVLKNERHTLLCVLRYKRSPNFDQTTRADLRVKLKESEKKDKNLDLARKLKKKTNKLWNMKVTIIPILIDALGTVTKGLIKGLEDLEIRERVETIQTTTLLRSARILRRVLEI